MWQVSLFQRYYPCLRFLSSDDNPYISALSSHTTVLFESRRGKKLSISIPGFILSITEKHLTLCHQVHTIMQLQCLKTIFLCQMQQYKGKMHLLWSYCGFLLPFLVSKRENYRAARLVSRICIFILKTLHTQSCCASFSNCGSFNYRSVPEVLGWKDCWFWALGKCKNCFFYSNFLQINTY